ncbi:AMP-binding protein [Brevibacterium album]|uniref:AMP-binding protein n=1 Tax=Brevibacterium album TaxID=417948 RepID=UPI000423CC37|nr:AMP-binding protein [Brevibacterium album]
MPAGGEPASGPMLRSGEREQSLSETYDRARRLAGGLRELGLRAEDRCAIVMRNETAVLEANLAAAALDAHPIPVNWHWTGEDLRHLLQDSQASLVIAHSDLLPAVERHAPEGTVIVEAEVPPEVTAAYGVGEVPLTGRHPVLEELIAAHEPAGHERPAPPLGVIYTSGTTGLPKGILRERPDPALMGRMLRRQAQRCGLRPGVPTVLPAPLYHTAPHTHAMFALAAGLDITVMPRFDAEEFLRIVDARRVATVQMVPTMFHRLLALPREVREAYDVSSLELVVHAAAPCTPALKEAMIDWFGPVVCEYYGGSESGAWTYVTSAESLERPGTVGRANPDCELRILRADGTWAGPGETGVIYGRNTGSQPDFTYIGDEGKRRSIEVDGFLTVGDIGWLDEDGYLYLSDRASDMVISGGVNIYPAEIEAAIHSLDGVEDVAVFGVPDEEFGESLVACVQPAAGAALTPAAITEALRGSLAGYKVPRTIRFEEQLPREDSGKLFKRRLRQGYLDGTAEGTRR